MKRLLAVFLLAGLAGCAGVVSEQGAKPSGSGFRWELNGTGQTKTFVPEGIPSEGAYTVRFRAALMNAANGGRIVVEADGVCFRCTGDGFTLDNAGENHVIPGQLDDRNFDFSLRNRCYHDFLFVCLPDRIVLFGDGKEKRPVLKAKDAPHGFSFASVGADVDVTGFEAAAGDLRGTWSSRNMAINGGFEELNGGFPPYWTTYNFGFGSSDEIADLDGVRARYRIDDTVAWEGRNSMLLDGTWVPFWECFMTRPKDEDYVFSAYVRTDCPGTKLELMADCWYNTFATKVVTVGSADWTRFELPFHSKFNSFRCGVRLQGGKGRAWIDGAQVEKGSKATDYVVHPCPCNDVPPNPPKVMDHYYATLKGARQPSGKPPRMARVDPKRNSFRFGDREYFMYGFTGFAPDTRPVTKRALDQLQKWGMNMHLAHGNLPKDPAKLRAALDECEKRGIKTSFAIRYDKKSGKLDTAGLAAVEAVADHPALLSIDLFDECYGQVTQEKRLAIADEVRRHTGNRIPISFNEFDLGVISHMDFSAADIASGDFYVPGLQEISAQYYILKQLRDDNPDQVVAYYPMAAGHFSTWPRDATSEETVAQAYIGYVLEVFNIKWWQAVPTTEAALEGIIRAKRERDLIDPSAFLDGEPADVKCESRNDAVKFTARRMRNGMTRVIVVNIENRPNAAKWTLPSAPKSATALVGKGPDKVVGATIEDEFGPLERRVYDIGF